MLVLFLTMVGCSGDPAGSDGGVEPRGEALVGTLFVDEGGPELDVEAQRFSDGSITVRGSDGAYALELTVFDAATQVGWGRESPGPIPMAFSFTTPMESYSDADIEALNWNPLPNGKYDGGFVVPGSWNPFQIGETTPVDFHCIGSEGQICDEQIYDQFNGESPTDAVCNWQPGPCPRDQVLGYCASEDGEEGSYFLQPICDQVGEPLPDGTVPIPDVEALCNQDGGVWTEAGEASCG